MEHLEEFSTEVPPGTLFAPQPQEQVSHSEQGHANRQAGDGTDSPIQHDFLLSLDGSDLNGLLNVQSTTHAADAFVSDDNYAPRERTNHLNVDEVDREADALGVAALRGTAAATDDDDDEFNWQPAPAATTGTLVDARRSGGVKLAPSSAQEKRQMSLPPAVPALRTSTANHMQVSSAASTPSSVSCMPPPPPAGAQQLLAAEVTSAALLSLRQQFVAQQDTKTVAPASALADTKARPTITGPATEVQIVPSLPQQHLGSLTEVVEADEDEDDEEEEQPGENGERARVASADQEETGNRQPIRQASSEPVGTDTAEREAPVLIPSAVQDAQAHLEDEFAAASLERQHEQGSAESPKDSTVIVALVPAPATDICASMLTDRALAAYHSSIVTDVDAGGGGILACFAGFWKAKLREQLVPQRDAIFCLAKHSYRSDNPSHAALMSSLYCTLTGGRSAASPSASWQDIGFQRDGDFTTDLRGAGMLGPLQVYAMMHSYPWLGQGLYRCSRDPMAPFPFMVQCINMSAKTLQLCRTGKLTALMNQRAQASTSTSAADWPAWTVFMDVYCALSLLFMEQWTGGMAGGASPPSISRIGHIVQASVDRANRDIGAVVTFLMKKDSEAKRGSHTG